MNAIVYGFYLVISGIYFAVTLILGLELAFDFFRLKRAKITPPMHLFGVGMILDSVFVFLDILKTILWPDAAFFSYIFSFLDLAVTVLILMAGFSLMTGRYSNHRNLIFVVLPAILIFILFVITGNQLLFSILSAVFLFIVITISLIHLRQYHKRLDFYYSNVEDHKLTWFVTCLVWVIFVYPMFKTLSMGFSWSEYAYFVYMISMICMYLFISRNVYSHTTTPFYSSLQQAAQQTDTANTDSDGSQITAHSVFSNSQLEEMEVRLHRLMAEDKLYRNPDLCVDDLVTKLGTNTSYFYYFMRDVVKASFFDYVNGIRIEEAKKGLLRGDKVETIAEECGFNSANSFRRVFKKITELTPSEWREKQQQSGNRAR